MQTLACVLNYVFLRIEHREWPIASNSRHDHPSVTPKVLSPRAWGSFAARSAKNVPQVARTKHPARSLTIAIHPRYRAEPAQRTRRCIPASVPSENVWTFNGPTGLGAAARQEVISSRIQGLPEWNCNPLFSGRLKSPTFNKPHEITYANTNVIYQYY